jgi:hypothetical protein
MRHHLVTGALLLFGVISSTAGEVPELFTRKKFNCATLANAANYYIGLGEGRAIKEMKLLEKDFSAERIGWICRIIFDGKNGEVLRPPMYGGLLLPKLTMPLDRWPRYPVAESEGIFFVLSEGYMLAGMAERASAYIDYCSSAGVFRTNAVKVPTKAEAVKAFEALKESKPWKAIKWKDKGPGTKYTMNEEWVLRGIESQAISVPQSKTEQDGIVN